MQWRIWAMLGTAMLAITVAACSGQRDRAVPTEESSTTETGGPLYAARSDCPGVPSLGDMPALDPIVVHEGRLSVIEKQEVPCQREGVLLVIGTEAASDEEVPADRLLTLASGEEKKSYRRLKEDDRVAAGQLLAQLDDRLARDDLAIKSAKVVAAKADLAAAVKTCAEARERFLTQEKLAATGGAAAREEVRGAKLTWERYQFECDSKREAVRLAELERSQAQTVLGMHQVRSSIPGVVKTIYKKRGEAVKALEPVFQVHDLSRLRVEGMIEVEYLPRLRKGMMAVVEPTVPEGPVQTLQGHLQEVTAIAISPGKPPLIVSGSEDGSVRVWERGRRQERRVFLQSSAVKSLACAPAGAPGRWCLAGGADGSARLWDLSGESKEPLRVLQGDHKGAVTCVAFTPDGKHCATGGDDREIGLWDAVTGERSYPFPAGHRAAVTALQFTPQSRLVSAGRDNTLRVWSVGPKGAQLEETLDRRSGDVAWPGISPDGRHVLLDQGKALRLLTLADRRSEGVLQNGAEASQFNTFALFAPDAHTVLTAGAAEGRLQLWRCPTAGTRPELRQFVTREGAAATCAAFAPDGSFAVSGTQDHQVLVWALPQRAEVETQRHAQVTLIEPVVESSARQVKLWAEVSNPDGRLLPGTTVTLAFYPSTK